MKKVTELKKGDEIFTPYLDTTVCYEYMCNYNTPQEDWHILVKNGKTLVKMQPEELKKLLFYSFDNYKDAETDRINIMAKELKLLIKIQNESNK